jgi:hypothetical protein
MDRLTLAILAIQPNAFGKQADLIRVFPAQAGTHISNGHRPSPV